MKGSPLAAENPREVTPLSRLRNAVRVDRAIAYAVAGRLWQFLAGGLSLWIIATRLSPVAQGFYYAFLNLLAIQTFFDLGLTGVLVYVSSHEWSAAENPGHAGHAAARQRLGELLIRSRRWYLFGAGLFALIAGAVGYWFFVTESTSGVNWELPWFSAVAFTSLSLALAPSIAMLEGCNQMATVNAYRFGQAVVGNLCVWPVLLLGGGLWAIPCSAAIRAGFDAWLAHGRFREFFGALERIGNEGEKLFSWRTELLPLQWRIALQSVAGYFAMGLYTAVIFKFHGPVAGGQMGMTWTAISTVQMAAFAWVYTRVPEIGRLLADRRDGEARQALRRALAVSTGMYLAGVAALLTLIWCCQSWAPRIAARLLDLRETALLCLGLGLTHVAIGFGTYVRARKIDPFLGVNLCGSLALGCLVWYLGDRYGATGVALAHIGVTGLLTLPSHLGAYLWLRETG